MPQSIPPGLKKEHVVQALNDLGGSYRQSVERMQPLLFGARDVVLLLIVCELPALPFIVNERSFKELVVPLVRLLAGA